MSKTLNISQVYQHLEGQVLTIRLDRKTRVMGRVLQVFFDWAKGCYFVVLECGSGKVRHTIKVNRMNPDQLDEEVKGELYYG